MTGLEWRYAAGGDVKHAVRRVPQAWSAFMVSVCGIGPWHAADWLGTGAGRTGVSGRREEAERLAGLLVCQRCAVVLDGDGVRVVEVPADVEQMVAGVVEGLRSRYPAGEAGR